MRYEFVDIETGERYELEFPMSQAPSLDKPLEHEGRVLRRIITNPAISTMTARTGSGGMGFFKPHVSEQIERWHPDAPAHTKDGRAVISTRGEMETMINRINDRNDKDGLTDRMEIRD